MKVLTLGPEGTFSHEATKRLFPKKKIVFGTTIDEVFFRLAEKEIAAAVLPLENTLSGFVDETITNLMKYNFSITGKTSLKITYHLAGKGKVEEAKTVYAQPHAYRQCKKKLKKLCPAIKVIETPNNAHSALQLKAHEKDPTVFALVPPFALEYYSLPIAMSHFQEDPENITTFYSIGKAPEKKTGKDSTAFLIFSDPMVTIEKQIKTLALEKKTQLLHLKNLLLQEGHTPLYFVEIQGHIEDKNVTMFFEALSEKFLIKHLGSYPQ